MNMEAYILIIFENEKKIMRGKKTNEMKKNHDIFEQF